jgi:hypothetical protein
MKIGGKSAQDMSAPKNIYALKIVPSKILPGKYNL